MGIRPFLLSIFRSVPAQARVTHRDPGQLWTLRAKSPLRRPTESRCRSEGVVPRYQRRKPLTEAGTSSKWRSLGRGKGRSPRISPQVEMQEGLRKQPAHLCPVMLPPISHSWASPIAQGERDQPQTPPSTTPPLPTPPFHVSYFMVRAKGSYSQHGPIWEVLPLKIQ